MVNVKVVNVKVAKKCNKQTKTKEQKEVRSPNLIFCTIFPTVHNDLGNDKLSHNL